MRYPEIYDIENFESWKTKFLRKEVLSREWDLMSYEVCPDVFEVPIFSHEYCDKLVENLTNVDGAKIDIWGHDCEEINSLPEQFDLTILNLVKEYLIGAIYHHWTVDSLAFQKMKIKNHLIRFVKGQDLRVRHDSSIISCYVKFDSESEGGELFFPKYNFTLKPKQGHLYFFPGRLTHRYGINLIKSGINHSLFTYFTEI